MGKTAAQLDREIAEALAQRPERSHATVKSTEEKLPVKVGILTLDKPMTLTQAKRWGDRHMPADLKRAGFETFVGRSDPEMHGGIWYRVSYGYGGRGRKHA